MDIKFIGTGGAFDIEYGNSAAIINCNKKKILVDCGHTVFPKLMQLNLVSEIDYILITHLHDDHAGSLSSLIFYLHFFLPQKKVQLIAPANFHQELIDYLNFSQKNVLKFISIKNLPNFIQFIDTYNRHYPSMQTYSYIFSEQNEHIVYSGDLNDTSFLYHEVKKLNLEGNITIFHDVTFHESAKTAHAYYKDIESFWRNYKIYGYHCNSKLKPKNCKLPLVTENSEFLF